MNERGFVTVEFVGAVAFLMLPVALLVISLPSMAERVSMARVASREAARVYVLTKSQAQAQAAVDAVGATYTLPNRTMTVSFAGDPSRRGTVNDRNEVTATVHTTIPALRIPLFDISVGAIDVNESHTEAVDLYRSRE